MSGFKEVLFISDDSDPASSVDCYDLQLGTKIGMYASGHGVVRGSLHILNEEYFLSAEVCKPPLRGTSNIHVWSIDTRNQVKRVGIPGEVTALGASEDGFFCAAGINNKIYVWNIASGQLLNIINYHHEPITKIVFWNSNYILSCGTDGLVAVWRLVDVVSKESGDSFGPSSSCYQAPYFSSSKHALPITDMFLAPGGNTCRLFTVSADQNCHIFSIGPDSGKFIVALTYDFVLTSVLCDHLQRMLYVGTTCGKVILFSLELNSKVNVRHVSSENCLAGHEGAIKAFSITQDDDLLATGSDDKKVIVWNVTTKQQLHTCDMHGHISNLSFHIVKTDFLTPGPMPRTIVSNFDRNILCDPENMEIKISVKNEVTYDEDITVLEDRFLFMREGKEFNTPRDTLRGDEQYVEVDTKNDSGSDSEPAPDVDENEEPSTVEHKKLVKLRRQVFELKAMNNRLKRVNKKLYIFALEQVWQQRSIRDPTT